MFTYHPISDEVRESNCNDNKVNRYNRTMNTYPWEISMPIQETFSYPTKSIRASWPKAVKTTFSLFDYLKEQTLQMTRSNTNRITVMKIAI
jgi:hypothetical protein